MHTVNSPLGKYGQLVAAISALLIIGSWIVGEFLHGMNILQAPVSGLKEVALIAVGAVFGAAAAVNGVKPSIDAAHTRLDKIGVPSAHDVLHETPTV